MCVGPLYCCTLLSRSILLQESTKQRYMEDVCLICDLNTPGVASQIHWRSVGLIVSVSTVQATLTWIHKRYNSVYFHSSELCTLLWMWCDGKCGVDCFLYYPQMRCGIRLSLHASTRTRKNAKFGVYVPHRGRVYNRLEGRETRA